MPMLRLEIFTRASLKVDPHRGKKFESYIGLRMVLPNLENMGNRNPKLAWWGKYAPNLRSSTSLVKIDSSLLPELIFVKVVDNFLFARSELELNSFQK